MLPSQHYQAYLLYTIYPVYFITNSLPHFLLMVRNVLHAISCTPGNVSLMNSNNFLTTVFRKFQLVLRNLGYYPTTYMILDATTALFSLPFFYSHRVNRFLMVWIKNCFSSCSGRHPDIAPMAQQMLFRLSNDHSDPSI